MAHLEEYCAGLIERNRGDVQNALSIHLHGTEFDPAAKTLRAQYGDAAVLAELQRQAEKYREDLARLARGETP